MEMLELLHFACMYHILYSLETAKHFVGEELHATLQRL